MDAPWTKSAARIGTIESTRAGIFMIRMFRENAVCILSCASGGSVRTRNGEPVYVAISVLQIGGGD